MANPGSLQRALVDIRSNLFSEAENELLRVASELRALFGDITDLLDEPSARERDDSSDAEMLRYIQKVLGELLI